MELSAPRGTAPRGTDTFLSLFSLCTFLSKGETVMILEKSRPAPPPPSKVDYRVTKEGDPGGHKQLNVIPSDAAAVKCVNLYKIQTLLLRSQFCTRETIQSGESLHSIPQIACCQLPKDNGVHTDEAI